MSEDTIPEDVLRKIKGAKRRQVTKLNLSSSNLTKIPEEVFKLTHIRVLDLSDNKINELPESIGNLSNLTELSLSDNQLKNLPKSIGNLSNLTQLDLSNNQLKNLPEFIGDLSNLTRLNLSKNQLKILPKSIGNLSNLTWLNLNNNNLVKLPESIGNLSRLIWLHLENNPLETPPIEVANKSINAIKEYFQQLNQVGEDYLYEAKLLIVGEPAAGKTSLAKKIQDPKYKLQANEACTEGIDVINWSFPILDKEQKTREFKVNIWDFGGNVIYYATHKFFLTQRSLYILVADSRKEDTDFYYWLNIVELLSNNSPLLIIKNEKQDHTIDINERALRGQFSNLRKTLATNLANNRGLEEILTDIKHYIQTLPHIGQTLPKTWVKVRQVLKNYSHNRNYISLQEYLDICEDNGIIQLEDKLQLSGYLHDLGICLHFQDNKNSLLYETIILKPEWATDAVYKVLDNKGVMNNQGCFNNSDLDKIWSEENYAGIQGRLLELMIKFQLCYEIPQQKDTFIAPQVLSDNQPEYDWNDSNNLILRYTYHDFMPKGIITRFIVIMHQYIDQQKYVWKTGVILIKDNAKAEVIEDYGKREIKIRVAGTNKRNFMTIVTHELDKINDSYQQLKYEKLVPCHCNACKNSQNPFAYDFNKLLERYAHSKLTIECGNPPYNEVQVLGLIDNAIDIKQLIPQDNQYGDKSIKFADHIQQFIFLSAEKGNITGNFSELIRNIKIGQGNYNEHIEGDYKDQRRAQNIMAKTIDVQSANAFDLGDISEEIAKTIKTLPDFDEPNKKELKLILIELHNTVLEETLDTEEKAEILKQIQTIAAALQNSQDTATKKTSQKAMKMLLGNAVLLPSDRSFVTICNQLPELIAKIFES